MVSVKDLARETRTIKVPLSDDIAVSLTYKPRYYTLSFEEELQAVTGTALMNATMLCAMVTDWDMTDDDGNAAAIDVETIKRLGIPNAIVMKLIDGITDDMRPKEMSKNGSSRS